MRPGGPELRMNPWLPAIAVMLSAAMEMLDTSVVNVSLPHIAGSLSATVDEATWVLTSYIVANAIVLPISGWLASYFGRKRLLMAVVTGFTVSSVLCGLTPSLPWLIFFRLVQGTTGGGLVPLSQAILLESFPVEERGKAMAFWGIGMIAFPILGPTVGGWLTDNYSWRWVFYVNLPVGLASLVMMQLFITDPPYLRKVSKQIDAWGLGLLVVGMGALQILLDKGQEEDWFGSHMIVACAIVSVVGLTAFVWRQLRTREPLVDFHLLKYGTFTTGVFIGFVLGFVLFGSLVLLPLLMQQLLGFPAVTAGIWSSPRGIGTIAVLPLTGILLGRRFDPRILLTLGLVLASVSFFGYGRLNLAAGGADFMWPQIVQGAGLSMVFTPLSTIAMDQIPLGSMGFATSLFSMSRNIGSSMGISFVTTELVRRTQFHQARLVEAITPYSPWVQHSMSSLGNLIAGSDPTGSLRAAGVIYGQVLRQASAMSFFELFDLLGILFLCVTPLIWTMSRPQHHTQEKPAPVAVAPSPSVERSLENEIHKEAGV
jgi:MFS transporter, DHA2 family, multidrug resistance protein